MNRGVGSKGSSLESKTVSQLIEALAWTAKTQLASIAKAFERLDCDIEIPVWLSVQRHGTGYESATMQAAWEPSDRLTPIDDEQRLLSGDRAVKVDAYSRLYASGQLRKLGIHILAEQPDKPMLTVLSKAMNLAKEAGEVCAEIDVPDLGITPSQTNSSTVHWICVLHRLHCAKLLFGADAELATPFDELSGGILGEYQPVTSHDGKPIDSPLWSAMRHKGFVWKIPDFIRYSRMAADLITDLPSGLNHYKGRQNQDGKNEPTEYAIGRREVMDTLGRPDTPQERKRIKPKSITQHKLERGEWMLDNCDPSKLTDLELQEKVNREASKRGWPLYESEKGNGAYAGYETAYLKRNHTPYHRDDRGKNKRAKRDAK